MLSFAAATNIATMTPGVSPATYVHCASEGRRDFLDAGGPV